VVLKEPRRARRHLGGNRRLLSRRKGFRRRTGFVANLAVSGQNLTAQRKRRRQTAGTVKLSRKPTGDSFEFRGQIGIAGVTRGGLDR